MASCSPFGKKKKKKKRTTRFDLGWPLPPLPAHSVIENARGPLQAALFLNSNKTLLLFLLSLTLPFTTDEAPVTSREMFVRFSLH